MSRNWFTNKRPSAASAKLWCVVWDKFNRKYIPARYKEQSGALSDDNGDWFRSWDAAGAYAAILNK